MNKYRKNIGIIGQIAIMFAIGILVIGLVAFFTQQIRYDRIIRTETETRSEDISQEVYDAVYEYPASKWLIRYWYVHSDDLDIEYDVDYTGDTETEKKARKLSKKYPDIEFKYATIDEVESMDPQDQKAYAEVTYSWLITRINQIKKVNDVDYLFCVIPYDSFHKQFFLFSAADPGSERGTELDQTYPLGHKVEIVDESQKESMLAAARDNRIIIASAGDYVDCYSLLGEMDNWPILIGTTYNVTKLIDQVGDNTKRSTLFAGLYQLLLAFVCMLLLYRFVLKPLKKVIDNIRMYKENKDSSQVEKNLSEIASLNEIGQLARDVSDLTSEIDDYTNRVRNITAENERISTELSVANRIQKAMLPGTFPAFPGRNDFDIYASMDPAREVGGDFYDFQLIDDDHLYMVIADVSGKGVPAALFMMASRIILANNAAMGKSPAQILKDTNNSICSNNKEEMFVTVWIGILEISTGKLTAANAGHEYPVIKRPEGQYEMIRDKHGFVVGGMEGIEYTQYEITLEPGSSLFVYTDGVPEATNANKEMYGVERLLEALNDSEANTPEDVLRNAHMHLDRFTEGEEQFDDLTMMCLQLHGGDEKDTKEE